MTNCISDPIGEGPLDYIIDGKFLVHKIQNVSSEVIYDSEAIPTSVSSACLIGNIHAAEGLVSGVSTEQIIEAKCKVVNQSIAQHIAQLYDRLVTSYKDNGQKRKVDEPPFVRGVFTTGLNYEFFQLTRGNQEEKPAVHHYGSLHLRVFDELSAIEVGKVLAAFVVSFNETENIFSD